MGKFWNSMCSRNQCAAHCNKQGVKILIFMMKHPLQHKVFIMFRHQRNFFVQEREVVAKLIESTKKEFS